MNGSRFRTLMEMDLRFHFTRPMFWVLVASLGLITWGLSSGGLTISTGDSSIGGTARAWVTSEFAIALMLPIMAFILYSFFVAVAAGMLIPRDDELKVGPVLHATPLRPSEYVWAKFAAVTVMFLVVLGLHLGFSVLFNQMLPNAQAELIRGPFEVVNYLRPALIMTLPFLIFIIGVSFAVGELTRSPILIFATPVALFVACVAFLWSWSPSWLDPRINQLLMWLEPSGFRWLQETWLKVDLGVDFYNHQPVGYDVPFLISRLIWGLIGVGSVALAGRHFAASLRGTKADTKVHTKAGAGSEAKRRWPWRRRAVSPGPDAKAVDFLDERPVTDMKMSTGKPGFLASVVDVARFEAKNLRSQPGLYIFIPLIILQVSGSGFSRVGAFDTPLLLTPGAAAVGSMNTLTLLVCFLLLFYTVESIGREWHTGLAPMYYATPARTAAVLTGKAVANSLVGAAILIAAYVSAALVMWFQGKVSPDIGPFVLVWGFLLVPTFLLWSTFVTFAWALTRNRYSAYALGLAVLAYTGWKQFRGEMNWVGNWNLWNAATWTDFGGLDPNTYALALNRGFWLAVAAFLVVLTVRIFPRREHDPGRLVDRLRPASLVKTALRLSPIALPAIVLGVALGVEVSSGYQGGAVERREEEYRGRNLVTWGEAETPWIHGVEIDLSLEPEASSFEVRGTYDLVNKSDQPMRRFPMSVGDHFEDLKWTLNGQEVEPEDWARMHVFTLDEPLAVGDTVRVGFSHQGRFPAGVNKNGGGLGQFILPSGVVLTSFASELLPVPLFETGRGADQDNALEPRDFEDDHWHGRTPPAFGAGARYPVTTRITIPEAYRANGVGTLESDTVTNGMRTMEWVSDHPVNFFNVVAGKWDVWEGDGVKIFHHPDHSYNLEEMGEALEGARKYYSEWFYEFPWQELKVSEFAGLASYAQGFPTNITFSESIGFLTESKPEAELAFMVTAHEAAHQWWGNILMPGRGPGGNVLSEGLAHFSTALLFEQIKGDEERIGFLKQIEERYGDARQVDSEKPLVRIDGSKAGDTTVTYDKGGWVFWMLLQHLGREAGLAGYSDFIHRYAQSDDYPVLEDFVAVMREHATDVEAFDAFTEQWFFDVVLPEYRFGEPEVSRQGERWVAEVKVTNTGTGDMPIQVAAVRGERFPEDDAEEPEPWHESRTEVVLGEGESTTVRIECDFEPEQIMVDPDAMVLMLKREKAVVEL